MVIPTFPLGYYCLYHSLSLICRKQKKNYIDARVLTTSALMEIAPFFVATDAANTRPNSNLPPSTAPSASISTPPNAPLSPKMDPPPPTPQAPLAPPSPASKSVNPVFQENACLLLQNSKLTAENAILKDEIQKLKDLLGETQRPSPSIPDPPQADRQKHSERPRASFRTRKKSSTTRTPRYPCSMRSKKARARDYRSFDRKRTENTTERLCS